MTEQNGGVQRVGNLVASHQRKSASKATLMPSAVSCEPLAFAKSMTALTALKRTATFTKEELQAWHAVLAGYKPATINRAVLLVVSSQERFPELSDLLQQCRKIERVEQPYNPHGGDVPKALTEPELKAIAARIGLEV